MPGSVCRRSEMNRRLVQVDPALIGPDYPGDNFHQRAFAGAVFTHHSMNGPERAREINVGQCRDATVPFGDPFQLQERRAYRVSHQSGVWCGFGPRKPIPKIAGSIARLGCIHQLAGIELDPALREAAGDEKVI
jgi:hypothetical protein